MKTINKNFGLIVLAVIMLSFNVSASTSIGETGTDMGKYWLKKAVNPIVVKGNILETYVIHYDHFRSPVYVGILPGKKCTTYLVRTDGYEVIYTCSKGRFGIEYTPKELATIPMSEMQQKLDRNNFLRQRIITRGPASQKKHLGLIASYFPEVVK